MYLHQTKEAKKKIVLQYLKGLKLKGRIIKIGESLTDIILDMGEGVKKGITIRIDPYPHMYQIGIVMEGIEHRICGTDPLTGKEALIDILDKEDEIHTCMEETHNW